MLSLFVGDSFNENSYSSKTENNNTPFVLIQLFTSQGCSSCPAADRLLERIDAEYNSEVILLSYHVDYWNRLGWKDPFSSEEYSEIQYNYERKFKHGSVYTPEAVVNGDIHFVGSNETKLRKELGNYLNKLPENSLKITNIEKNGPTLSFSYIIEGPLKGKTMKATLVIDQRTTEVKRGENGGRSLSNTNIVVNETDIPLIDRNGKVRIHIPDLVKDKDDISLITFLQNEKLEITGAVHEKVNN